MKSGSTALITWLGLCCATGPALAGPPPAAIQVHGHRGARARFPENSLPAFEHAMAVGADYLEMDLAITRDGVVVISHDPFVTPERCLDAYGHKLERPVLIHSLRADELRRYDCGSLPNPKFTEQRKIPGTFIPTLEEVFAFVKRSSLPAARRIGFNIETKIFADHPEYTVGPQEFVTRVLALVRKHGLLERTVLQSFDPRTLIEARARAPQLRRAILIEKETDDMLALAKETGAQIVSPDHKLLTPERVMKLHEAGYQILPWTVNNPDDWARLRDMKVDGIITDDPERLREFLRK